MAESMQVLLCDTCKDSKVYIDAVILCEKCRELYCTKCVSMHKALRATRDHILIQVTKLDSNFSEGTVLPECETCVLTGKGKQPATFLCEECRELYCHECKQHHTALKATKHHILHQIEDSSMAKNQIPVNSINLSSDFEGFEISSDKNEYTHAQAPVKQPKSTTHNPSRVLSKKDIKNLSAKLIATFKGKTSSDTEQCRFKGIVALSDGRIILLDWANHNIKMFDKCFNVLCVVQTGYDVWGMVKVSEEAIAVVSGNSVHFYLLQSNSLVQDDTEFKLVKNGCGISFNGKKYAILCGTIGNNNTGCISIRSLHGKETNIIGKFKHYPSVYIYLDPDENDMYISTVKTNILSCISDQGKLRWEKQFFGPRDIIKFYNCILIASSLDDAIYCCDKDGTFMQIIIQDEVNLHRAEYIAYNANTQQLYVTRGLSDEVAVLQISF